MNRQGLYDRILGSLHEAALDDAGWPGTAGLIDAACGLKGNILVFGEGRAQPEVEIYGPGSASAGTAAKIGEQEYFRDYWTRDERLPRLRQLPHGRLAHATELFSEAERKTSATYNEALRKSDVQNGLDVRLDGPDGTRVVWVLGDPVETSGWGSGQTRMVERLLPHVRQFVLVRQRWSRPGRSGSRSRDCSTSRGPASSTWTGEGGWSRRATAPSSSSGGATDCSTTTVSCTPSSLRMMRACKGC